MSTDNRLGRNPFDKAKTAKAEKTPKTKKILKASDKKTEAATQAPPLDQPETQPLPKTFAPIEAPSPKVVQAAIAHEEQIIGELIELPEENWQPLTIVPSAFFKQILARWI